MRNSDSWAYKKGYEDGFKWGHYDYGSKPGPEYDAGFMAGYFENNGYTFEGQTYAQREAERKAEEEKFNQYNQLYQNNPQLAQSVNIGSGTILSKIVDLLKSLLHLIFLLFIRTDEQNAQAAFGNVSSTTVKMIRILKAGVIALIIWGVISVSSLFKDDSHSDKVEKNISKPQQTEELVYSQNAEKPKDDNESVEAQLRNEESDKATNEKSAITTDETVNFGPYIREQEKRIKLNWNPPITDTNILVKVRYTIAKDGRLLSYEITQSSGIMSIDRSAVEAIKLTAPFRPLPLEFKGKSVDIEYTFEQIKRKQ